MDSTHWPEPSRLVQRLICQTPVDWLVVHSPEYHRMWQKHSKEMVVRPLYLSVVLLKKKTQPDTSLIFSLLSVRLSRIDLVFCASFPHCTNPLSNRLAHLKRVPIIEECAEDETTVVQQNSLTLSGTSPQQQRCVWTSADCHSCHKNDDQQRLSDVRGKKTFASQQPCLLFSNFQTTRAAHLINGHDVNFI